MTLVLGVGIVSMATVLLTGNPYVCLFGFCSFEATCGIYFPAMGMLRGEYLPNDTRSTIMNLARVSACLRPPAAPTGHNLTRQAAHGVAFAGVWHVALGTDLYRRCRSTPSFASRSFTLASFPKMLCSLSLWVG